MKNIIMIIRDEDRGDMYLDRVQKYFDHVPVASWVVRSIEQFKEATNRPGTLWNVLLVEVEAVRNNYDLLERFVQMNPGIVVGVEYRIGVAHTVKYPDAIQVIEPVDLDEWLRNMHELMDG